MTLIDVKKSLIALLKTLYSDNSFNYYASDVVEGYHRPCFFTKLVVNQCSPVNFNTNKVEASFHIAYLQDFIDETDIFNFVNNVTNLFGLYVCVDSSDGDKCITVTNSEWDLTGSEDNVLELSFDLEWFEDIDHSQTGFVTMSDVFVNRSVE